jgi:hypothetical protein
LKAGYLRESAQHSAGEGRLYARELQQSKTKDKQYDEKINTIQYYLPEPPVNAKFDNLPVHSVKK